MDIGWAIDQAKKGERVRRACWRSTKDAWITVSGTGGPREVPAHQFSSRTNQSYAESNGGFANVLPCITMKTADGSILMGWAPSQIDLLAEDWELAG